MPDPATPTPPSWKVFFDEHAPQYEANCFTKNTAAEIEFLIHELELEDDAPVLDVGCGTGRHSIALARKGYRVTGLDLSPGMLEQARQNAAAAGVQVEWIEADATDFSLENRFAAAICLCEGAFGLLSNRDDPILQPFSILRNISRSLRSGGRFLLTALNGAAFLRRYQNSDAGTGKFDILSMVESNRMAPCPDAAELLVRERGFVPTELVLLAGLAGFQVLHVGGGTAGNWGRRPIDLDEIEIMLLARKVREPYLGALF